MSLFALALVVTLASPTPRVVTDADLAPISLGPADAQARALMARRQWKAAAEKVGARTPEARLVKGWLQAQADEHGAALAALEGVPDELPLLADLARLLQAQSLLALERFAEAGAAAEPLLGDPDVGDMARRIRARALREVGQLDPARTVYDAIIASGRASEVPVGLLGRARLEAEAGHPERAVPLLRRVDVEYPAHWTAGHARRLAETLVAADAKLKKAWADRPLEEQVARGERLMKRHHNRTVVKALEPLMKKKKMKAELRCRHRYAYGRSLRKLRRWKKARPVLEDAVKACGKAKSELEPWARYLAGKAAERLSHEKEAAAHNRAQMKRNPEHRLADDAAYDLIHHLAHDRKDLDAARKALETLVRTNPAGDMVPRAVFYVALQFMRAERDEDARAVLALDAQLPPRTPGYRDDGRTAYWLARLDHKAGAKKKALAGYERVVIESPFRWYGLLAYSRLREADPDRAAAAVKAMLARTPSVEAALPGADRPEWRFTLPPDVDAAQWERARLLARLGLWAQAWAALKRAGAGPERAELMWVAAWVLDRAGAYHLSHDLLRRKLPEFRQLAPVGHTRKHWTLAFPDPFAGLVVAQGKASKVDPFLIRAIIREESGFNPGIESFANAVGLMQLIDSTAKHMAKKGGEKVTRKKLTDPDFNVKLGARYLAHVANYANARLPLVPAGYNAGAGALKRWMDARGELPLDLFVETIPFEEARGYLKRVVATWATYRFLYGGSKEKGGYPYLAQTLTKKKPAKKKADERAEKAPAKKEKAR